MKKVTAAYRPHTASAGSACVLLLAALFFLISPVGAQSRFSATVNPGLNLPLKKLGDADLNTGFGFEVSVAYRVLPHLDAYTGWGWSRFSADQSFAGTKTDFEETGYRLGLQFMHPIAQSKLKYAINGGAIYNHIEAENDKGDMIADTGHGWGWQAGAGLLLPCSKHFNLVPGLRYQSLSRTLTVNGSKMPVDLSYLSVQVGLSWSF